MQFKLWLEGIEEYEPFRGKIEPLARSFPFKHWFPDGSRVYLPFSTTISSETEAEIKDMLSDFHGGSQGFPLSANGYQLVDYRLGHACPVGMPKKIFRISKILPIAELEDKSNIENDYYVHKKLSDYKYQEILAATANYFNNLTNSFQNDPNRVQQTSFYVMISMDPHDVASMSTGRGWTSCMNLAGGAHSSDIYREVKNGGFVAYLIRSDDKEIKRPLARIHIRRFDGKKGSVAIPEETVYGTEVPGFLEKVKEWLNSKQGRIVPGRYKKMGGQWSDSFSNKELIAPDPSHPEDRKKIISWINRWSKPGTDKNKYFQYFQLAFDGFLKSKDWPKEFVLKIKNLLTDDLDTGGLIPSHWRMFNMTVPANKTRFYINYPEFVTKDIFDNLMKQNTNGALKSLLISKFPQFTDEGALKSISGWDLERLTKESPELVTTIRRAVSNLFEQGFRPDNPEFSIDWQSSVWAVGGKISDYIRKLTIFKPIPERLVKILVNFDVDSFDLEKESEKDAGKFKAGILKEIASTLANTGTDTPAVQAFYKKLLPLWSEMGGIGDFGHCLAKLGENGKDFLPFLEDKLNEFKEKIKDKQLLHHNVHGDASVLGWSAHYERRKEQTIEAFNYVIDAIKTGKGYSQKHSFPYCPQMDV
jgi:hypothetical protein